MNKMMRIFFVFFTIVATVLAANDKLNKLPKSHLILEYNWPEPIKNLKRLPHSESCNHFYLTKPDGNHVLKKCFGDDIFDYRSLRCTEKTFAKCWKDIVKKGNIKKVKREFLCPYHWGLYPDTEDCSQFYDCLSGKPYPRKCPTDTLFDKVERTCLPISKANCAGEQGNMKEVKRQFFCRNHRGLYPDTEDCSQFYDCFNGRPYSRKCPAGSMFDKIKRSCLPSSEARCAGEPGITKTDKDLSETTPVTKSVRISTDNSNAHSELSTKSGPDESISKELNSSEDVRKPSEQAKSSSIFKIITSHINEMTTEKEHIISSDNSKLKEENSSEDVKKPSTQAKSTSIFKIITSDINEMTTDKEHISSDNSKLKEENNSEDVKKPSTQAKSTPIFKIITSDINEKTTDKEHISSDNSKFTVPHNTPKTLTNKNTDEIVTGNEKSASTVVTEMVQEASSVSKNGSEKLQTAVSGAENSLTPENKENLLTVEGAVFEDTNQNDKIIKISTNTISQSEKSTHDREPRRKKIHLMTQTPDVTDVTTDDVLCLESLEGAFPHPYDKHKFIAICTGGDLKIITCPENMVYNDIFRKCM